ncbi:helix-turn-helix domain-containing protein [Marinilabilia salmonicolor]|uniref:helix-turn-helix domain-containing protein n=1 Tax=Marinilabilia salmonicolor TaxID=989 RepID=UPI0009D998B8|nr:helix-turn-helix domain-containing protein [Marinilabilia salmonicolor]
MKRVLPSRKTKTDKPVNSNCIRLLTYTLHLKEVINNKKLLSVLLIFLLFGTLALSQEKNIRIIVESLPGSTPSADTIFVCGNFNNWRINDPDYRLQRQPDGKLFVTIPQNQDTIEFKFSRGDWMKMETNANNSHLPNRQLAGEIKEPVMVRIENWQDIGGQRSLPFYVLILSAAILNGIFLIFLIKRKGQKYDRKKSSRTILWSLFLISILLGAVLFEFANPVWKFRLMLGFETLLFAAAPLALIFLKSFYPTDNTPLALPHWIPALLVFLFNTLRFSGIWRAQWLQSQIISDYFIPDVLLLSLGTILFVAYILSFLYKMPGGKKKKNRGNDIHNSPMFSPEIPDLIITAENKTSQHRLPEWSFLKLGTAINLLAVASGVILFILNESKGFIIQNYQDIPFSIASLQLFVIFYYVYFNESLFLPSKNIHENEPDLELAGKILNFMQTKKPYLDTELTLAGFAERLEIKPHSISKTINDCFNKNFRDFLNEFRVIEFIQKINSGSAKNRTFLYLAHESGFNSKSTFNLAFKKVTGLSPREYFNTKS